MIQPSFFGNCLENTDITAWPQLYVGVVRTWFSKYGGSEAHWLNIQPTGPGSTFVWTALDGVINEYATHVGNNIVYCFGMVPGWANGSGTGDVPPTHFSDLYNFVTAVVTRYRGRIKYYEIWNEINNYGAPDTGWWSGTLAQMVTIATNVYPLIKAADPNAIVLCPSTYPGFNGNAGGNYGFTYAQSFLAADKAAGGPHFDAFNYHGYASNTFPLQQPEQTLNIAQNYAGIAAQNGLSAMQVFVSEGGTNPNVAAGVAAAYTAIYLIMFASAGVTSVIWFQFDNGDGYGVLSDGGSWLNGSGIAYRIVQAWLSGSTFSAPAARVTKTNGVRNTTGTGMVAGTPGTPPTDWSVYSPDTAAHGISTEFVGSGTEGGAPYVDWRVFGTATAGAAGQADIFFEAGNQIAATLGQQWTVGADVKLQAGSASNVTVTLGMNENNGGGSFLANDTSWQFQPLANALNLDGQNYPGVTANASVAFVQPFVQVAYAVGVAIDITLRIGAPFTDNGSVWTATITRPGGYQAQITWDAAGGPTSYTVPGGYVAMRDITGLLAAIGSTVTLTNSPILLENAAFKGLLL